MAGSNKMDWFRTNQRKKNAEAAERARKEAEARADKRREDRRLDLIAKNGIECGSLKEALRQFALIDESLVKHQWLPKGGARARLYLHDDSYFEWSSFSRMIVLVKAAPTKKAKS